MGRGVSLGGAGVTGWRYIRDTWGSARFRSEVAVKKILASAVGSAAVAAAIFGAGTAHAVNEYAGLTYEQAAGSISSSGGTAVVYSRVGDYLPTEQCLVTGSRSGLSLDSSGNSRGNQVLLYLNCNDTKTAGHPGYSVMTPEGKKAQQTRQTAASINENFAEATAAGAESWCEKNSSQCANFCQSAGLCSAEVNEFLGI